MFVKATKTQARLRLALIGPAGSGKTFSALSIAKGLAPEGRVALIDTERGSASKYADKFDFHTAGLPDFNPERFVRAIREAEAAGYDVLIVDSLSHAWMGREGALEQVDKVSARSRSGNNFAAWREVTPMHNALVDALISSSCHIIATMRSKTEWVLETNDKGKQVPRKIGLAPVQRDGLEFEFDVIGDMDNATLVVSKTRCDALHDAVIKRPGAAMGAALRVWLTDGAEAPPPAATPAPEPPPPATNGKNGATENPHAKAISVLLNQHGIDDQKQRDSLVVGATGGKRRHLLTADDFQAVRAALAARNAKPGRVVDVADGESEDEAAARAAR